VLGHCTELIDCAPLPGGHASELRHLFAVRSPDRTYYMAAAGDDDLAVWIDSVRKVLKMYGNCGNRPLNVT